MSESDKRTLIQILGLSSKKENCGVMDRARIERMWDKERHLVENKIEPYYGNLYHLKDVEKKEFWLNDEELDKWLEQEEENRRQYLKESFVKGLK